jgi:hypothetical protein
MTNSSWKPWEAYPALGPDRLVIIGDVIRRCRDEAATDHRPDRGESNWSLGVRGFERTCAALTWASAEHPWLTVASGVGGGPVHFIFRIGILPIRFYRGSPDDAPEKYRQASFQEFREQQQALELDEGLPPHRCLRISIELDAIGRTAAVYLAEFDELAGEAVNAFEIPLLSGDVSVAPFVEEKPGVELPPPAVELISAARRKAQNDGA